jgi:hypothetical protein
MKITPIWYSKDVDLWKAVKFADCRQSAATGWRFGFVREIFYTKVIDISTKESELLSMLPGQTRRMYRSMPLHAAGTAYNKVAATLKGTPHAGIFHPGSPPPAAQGDEAAPRGSRTP